jgi:hypothetical protein
MVSEAKKVFAYMMASPVYICRGTIHERMKYSLCSDIRTIMTSIGYTHHKKNRPTLGPPLPPSRWPLQHVPACILDVIVDIIADAAVDLVDKPEIFKVDPNLEVFRPLSPELKNMSLVNKAFRRNIMEGKIIHTVVIKSPRHLTKVQSQFTQEGRTYIR